MPLSNRAVRPEISSAPFQITKANGSGTKATPVPAWRPRETRYRLKFRHPSIRFFISGYFTVVSAVICLPLVAFCPASSRIPLRSTPFIGGCTRLRGWKRLASRPSRIFPSKEFAPSLPERRLDVSLRVPRGSSYDSMKFQFSRFH